MRCGDRDFFCDTFCDGSCCASDGMAAVKLNGKWGFINSEGIIVVPCEYDEVEASFKDGKGKLVKDDEIYIFDKSGSQIDTYDKPRDDDDYYDGGYYDEGAGQAGRCGTQAG